jgi:hypothetical protein
MAARKKKKTIKKTAKRKAGRPAKKKTPTKRKVAKAARRTTAKRGRPARKTPVKKAKAAKAAKPAKAKTAVKTPARTSTRGEFGEGNYKASKRFREEQEGFVKSHRAQIPAMGKAAEAALEGAEGDELRAAEAEAANHAHGQDEE